MALLKPEMTSARKRTTHKMLRLHLQGGDPLYLWHSLFVVESVPCTVVSKLILDLKTTCSAFDRKYDSRSNEDHGSDKCSLFRGC